MILHSFHVSTLWYLGKILRPNSRIVSIEISFVFSQHPFSNRRYQHSSALIGNIHSSSTSRNIDHRRCHPFAAVAACFTNFRLHSPCVICDNHFLFPRIGSYHSGYLTPPQKKINNNTHSVGFHFLPNDLCVVMPGFWYPSEKFNQRNVLVVNLEIKLHPASEKRGNEYKARVPLHFIRTSTRLEAEIYLYCFLIIYI